MCIIVYKPAGEFLPEYETLQNCWDNNWDGAGFMYQDPSKSFVTIQKGFMKFDALMNALRELSQKENMQELELSIHFRMASHGKVNKGNCHPFPVTTNTKHLKAKLIKTDLAIVHNGIISFCGDDKNTSDTMVFVSKYLVNMKDVIFHPGVGDLIVEATKSKFVIMSPSEIKIIGNFIYNKMDGCYYSNSSYESHYYKTSYYSSKYSKYTKQTKTATTTTQTTIENVLEIVELEYKKTCQLSLSVKSCSECHYYQECLACEEEEARYYDAYGASYGTTALK